MWRVVPSAIGADPLPASIPARGWLLPPGDWSVGRNSESDIHLPVKGVSAKHGVFRISSPVARPSSSPLPLEPAPAPPPSPASFTVACVFADNSTRGTALNAREHVHNAASSLADGDSLVVGGRVPAAGDEALQCVRLRATFVPLIVVASGLMGWRTGDGASLKGGASALRAAGEAFERAGFCLSTKADPPDATHVAVDMLAPSSKVCNALLRARWVVSPQWLDAMATWAARRGAGARATPPPDERAFEPPVPDEMSQSSAPVMASGRRVGTIWHGHAIAPDRARLAVLNDVCLLFERASTLSAQLVEAGRDVVVCSAREDAEGSLKRARAEVAEVEARSRGAGGVIISGAHGGGGRLTAAQRAAELGWPTVTEHDLLHALIAKRPLKEVAAEVAAAETGAAAPSSAPSAAPSQVRASTSMRAASQLASGALGGDEHVVDSPQRGSVGLMQSSLTSPAARAAERPMPDFGSAGGSAGVGTARFTASEAGASEAAQPLASAGAAARAPVTRAPAPIQAPPPVPAAPPLAPPKPAAAWVGGRSSAAPPAAKRAASEMRGAGQVDSAAPFASQQPPGSAFFSSSGPPADEPPPSSAVPFLSSSSSSSSSSEAKPPVPLESAAKRLAGGWIDLSEAHRLRRAKEPPASQRWAEEMDAGIEMTIACDVIEVEGGGVTDNFGAVSLAVGAAATGVASAASGTGLEAVAMSEEATAEADEERALQLERLGEYYAPTVDEGMLEQGFAPVASATPVPAAFGLARYYSAPATDKLPTPKDAGRGMKCFRKVLPLTYVRPEAMADPAERAGLGAGLGAGVGTGAGGGGRGHAGRSASRSRRDTALYVAEAVPLAPEAVGLQRTDELEERARALVDDEEAGDELLAAAGDAKQRKTTTLHQRAMGDSSSKVRTGAGAGSGAGRIDTLFKKLAEAPPALDTSKAAAQRGKSVAPRREPAAPAPAPLGARPRAPVEDFNDDDVVVVDDDVPDRHLSSSSSAPIAKSAAATAAAAAAERAAAAAAAAERAAEMLPPAPKRGRGPSVAQRRV